MRGSQVRPLRAVPTATSSYQRCRRPRVADHNGKHSGRPPVITDDMLRRSSPTCSSPTGRRKGMNSSLSSIYRALAEHEKRRAYPEAVKVTPATPPRPVDVAAVFPQLAPLARAATRLHPRPGLPSPRDSSIGGPLLWPADEPWPHCEGPHEVDGLNPALSPADVRLERRIHAAMRDRNLTPQERETLERIRPPREYPHTVAVQPYDGSIAMLPVAQLYVRDVPGLHVPEGADVLQVLWCPFDHPIMPRTALFWRSAAAVTDIPTTPPEPPAVQAISSRCGSCARRRTAVTTPSSSPITSTRPSSSCSCSRSPAPSPLLFFTIGSERQLAGKADPLSPTDITRRRTLTAAVGVTATASFTSTALLATPAVAAPQPCACRELCHLG